MIWLGRDISDELNHRADQFASSLEDNPLILFLDPVGYFNEFKALGLDLLDYRIPGCQG